MRAILFESFAYPLIMVLSVPLATAGGVIGLWVLNQFTFQALDMLTLLGFVILIGIVVNNAILLVHQALYLMRDEGYGADADHHPALAVALPEDVGRQPRETPGPGGGVERRGGPGGGIGGRPRTHSCDRAGPEGRA